MPDTQPYVAVIDESIGFLNRRFRISGAPDQTRVQAIWLQAVERTGPHPRYAEVQIGRILRKPDIDAMLAGTESTDEGAAYRQLNDELNAPNAHRGSQYNASHGTHILDQAAGADPDHAADAPPILAVQLPPEAVGDTSGKRFESFVILGIRWILDEVGRGDPTRPGVVINISFGMLAGPKDGSQFLEDQIAAELDRWETLHPGKYARVVFAFGNGHLNRQVAELVIAPGDSEVVGWRIQPDDRTSSHMELYCANDTDRHALGLALSDPRGHSTHFGPVNTIAPPPPANFKIQNADGTAAIYELSERRPGGGPRPLLALAVAPTGGYRAGPVAPAGLWLLTITNSAPHAVQIRAEIQRDDTLARHRDDGRQSYFEVTNGGVWHDRFRDWTSTAGSIVSLEGTHSAIVTSPDPRIYRVGAGIGSTEEPAFYAAAGRPAPHWEKPDLSGLGEDGHALRGVLATGTFSGSTRALNGSSTAAAQITRRLADIMATAIYPDPPAANRQLEVAALVALADWIPDPSDVARLGDAVIAPPDRADGRHRIWP